MSQTDLCFKSATELAKLVRTKEISATELLEAHLAQIDRVNPQVNAIVTLVAGDARKAASAADASIANGDMLGPLHGLPIAHKDLVDTAGIRTTYGSPIYRDHVPSEDPLMIQRIRQAGAITIGKTNTPEFGAGSQTFNPVFGATVNPYDLTKTCGGSSGGAAVALATGMVPLADGSDMGGSLRNPAGFCNIAGFRVSPGRVPSHPSMMGWFPISVSGPMARTVEDVALLLSAMAGPDARSPIALADPGTLFAQPLARDFHDVKIAWSRDLGGLPVDQRVTDALDAQRHIFDGLGCLVADAEPDFAGADESFKVMRAWRFAIDHEAHLADHREQLKETVIWNAEAGMKLSAMDIGNAEKARTSFYHTVREFMEEYEYLILPVSQVPPFDVTTEFITEINGVQMETYIDWMKSCYYISAIGLPAISVPCGFTPEGLPVGIQIVGRHQNDLGVLQLAYAFEQATMFYQQRPSVAM